MGKASFRRLVTLALPGLDGVLNLFN